MESKSSFNEAKELLKYDLNTLGKVAREIEEKLFKDKITFVNDGIINYTNICTIRCKFCSFSKDENDPGSFTLKIEEILELGEKLEKIGVSQILIQGGVNPKIPYEYYLDILRKFKENFPKILIKAFSAQEIYYIAKNNKKEIVEVLKEFRDEGLKSFGGAGAEILDDSIRKKISPKKISTEEWIKIIKEAHKLGIKTSATMVYGFGESKETWIKHLLLLENIQKETNGFTAFIPWKFKISGKNFKNEATAYDYLQVIALSRIILKNIKNIQASYLTEGEEIGQLSLFYGANDFSGPMIGESVISNKKVGKTKEDIIKLIRMVGKVPVERDGFYNTLKIY